MIRKAVWAGDFDYLLIEPLNDNARGLAVKNPYIGSWFVPTKRYYEVQCSAASRDFEEGTVTTVGKDGKEYVYNVGYATKQDVRPQTKSMFDYEVRGMARIFADPKEILSRATESMVPRLLSMSRLYLPDSIADAIHEELAKTTQATGEYLRWMAHISAYLVPPFTINGEQPDMLQRLIESGYTSTSEPARSSSSFSLSFLSMAYSFLIIALRLFVLLKTDVVVITDDIFYLKTSRSRVRTRDCCTSPA